MLTKINANLNEVAELFNDPFRPEAERLLDIATKMVNFIVRRHCGGELVDKENPTLTSTYFDTADFIKETDKDILINWFVCKKDLLEAAENKVAEAVGLLAYTADGIKQGTHILDDDMIWVE